MAFHLNSQLENDTYPVTDLSLCQVLLMNNSLFPWLILVPRKESVSEIIELSSDDQKLLIQEISMASVVIKEVFQAEKLNVASLGNIVSQLHVHVVGRFKNDTAWPQPVFGQGSTPYTDTRAQQRLKELREKFNLV